MPIEDFELLPDGRLTTRPVLGWSTMTVAGMSVILRLHYAETPAEAAAGGRSVQVVMTTQQARDLAETLARASDQADTTPTQGTA